MIFRSKVNRRVVFLSFLILIALSMTTIVFVNNVTIQAILLVLYMLSFFCSLASVTYSIREGELIIRNRFKVSKIAISHIQSVHTFGDPAVPSASFNKLEILYGADLRSEQVSPEKQEPFIEALLGFNPHISIKHSDA